MSVHTELLKKIIKKHKLDEDNILYKGLALNRVNNKMFLYVITSNELILSDGKKFNRVIDLDSIKELSIKQLDAFTYEAFIQSTETQERFILLEHEAFDRFFERFKKVTTE